MPRRCAATFAACGALPAPALHGQGLAAGARLPSVRAKNRSRGGSRRSQLQQKQFSPQHWAPPCPPFFACQPQRGQTCRPPRWTQTR